MFILGLIKTERPDVLINPVSHSTPKDVFDWLDRFFNPADFDLETPITLEAVDQVLQSGKVGRINMNGYRVALLFGKTKVVEGATTRYIHLMPRSSEDVDITKIENLVIPD
ncbi:MAG: hypothetical protein J0I82_02505 [Spirosoma sp.]|uniref:hypothetical protein n=1 Tax=unclassified Spirosoma TaxID=2621999 RepID=UPI00095DBA07|nr:MULTISPECIES: hypothetical protein [unclassified Spirosoma]MBN8820869.1 hypothetical protein [Spirosoma sp.]OJW77875.1 MAG: hypothetical protein BGO59_23965 [Spirosoma sp. 48-14]